MAAFIMIPPTNSADSSSINRWLVLLDLHVGHVSPAVSLWRWITLLFVGGFGGQSQTTLSLSFQLVSPNFPMRERNCRTAAACYGGGHFPPAVFASTANSGVNFVQNQPFPSSLLQFHHWFDCSKSWKLAQFECNLSSLWPTVSIFTFVVFFFFFLITYFCGILFIGFESPNIFNKYQVKLFKILLISKKKKC